VNSAPKVSLVNMNDDALYCIECSDRFACDHVLNYMRENKDIHLPIGSVWVPMFKTVTVAAYELKPWSIPVIVGPEDSNHIGTVHYAAPSDHLAMGDVLCLVGQYDGRYAIRTAILNDLHAIEKEGQGHCGGEYHDGRFDVQYAGSSMARARLVDTYYRRYIGECYPCHLRSQSGNAIPGGLNEIQQNLPPRAVKSVNRKTARRV